MEIFALWLLCGIAAGLIGRHKGRSELGWLVLGWVCGPLAVLIVSVMAAQPTPRTHAKCAECQGWIPKTAKRCMHCGSDANSQARTI